MRIEKLVKTSQEQAVAAWVGLLNQLRVESLIEALNSQDMNLEEALATHADTLEKIHACIESNRGGDKGLHGFIAEIAECGMQNAQRQVHGQEANVILLDDNGPVDLLRGFTDVQMKFCEAGGKFSLNAVADHLDKYPWFLDDHSVYVIAKDHFETVQMLYEMPEEAAKKLARENGGPSYGDWKGVQEFFSTSGIEPKDIEPSLFEYSEVQKGAIDETMANEKRKLIAEDAEVKKGIYIDRKPTLQEGAKAAAGGAAMEAATSFALSVKRHLGGGKRIGDLTQDDWMEIAKDSGMGFAKGGIRGGAVYGLNNYTATPASVASALVSASFGVADCAYRFRSGELSEVEFIERSEIACLDASVSAFSSFVGQALIPVPVLGALVGNAVGTTVYELGKDFYSDQETALLERYTEEISDLDDQLEQDYVACIEDLRKGMTAYVGLLGKAFSPDVAVAFEGSIELAASLNVPEGEILHSKNEVDDFFLN